MTYKVVTKARDENLRNAKGMKQEFRFKDYFAACEVFESLKDRKELKVVMFNSNGEIEDHN
jgi:hypothetical protein